VGVTSTARAGCSPGPFDTRCDRAVEPTHVPMCVRPQFAPPAVAGCGQWSAPPPGAPAEGTRLRRDDDTGHRSVTGRSVPSDRMAHHVSPTLRGSGFQELIDLTIETFRPFYEDCVHPLLGDEVFRHQHGHWEQDYRVEVLARHDPAAGRHLAVAQIGRPSPVTSRGGPARGQRAVRSTSSPCHSPIDVRMSAGDCADTLSTR
jgi:hypothetical protein